MSEEFLTTLGDLRKDFVRLCLRIVAWIFLIVGIANAPGYIGSALYLAAATWLIGGILAWGVLLVIVDAVEDLERIADNVAPSLRAG